MSGVFSLTQQAIHLGFLPRLDIRHTAADQQGQVFLPLANWLLAAGTMATVLLFRSSDALASAYGIAVSGLMAISIFLAALVAIRWGFNPALVAVVNGAFFLLDLVFFAANGTKLVEGGWYPLLIGGVLALQMLTWRGGVRLLEAACVDQREDEERFLARLSRAKKRARQGSAPSSAPRREERRCRSLITCETTSRSSAAPLLVSVVPQEVPFVPAEERARVHRLGDGIYRVMLHFGFMEDPDVPAGAQAAPLGCRRRNSKRSATISVGRR